MTPAKCFLLLFVWWLLFCQNLRIGRHFRDPLVRWGNRSREISYGHKETSLVYKRAIIQKKIPHDENERWLFLDFCQWCSPVRHSFGRNGRDGHLIILEGKCRQILPCIELWKSVGLLELASQGHRGSSENSSSPLFMAPNPVFWLSRDKAVR